MPIRLSTGSSFITYISRSNCPRMFSSDDITSKVKDLAGKRLDKAADGLEDKAKETIGKLRKKSSDAVGKMADKANEAAAKSEASLKKKADEFKKEGKKAGLDGTTEVKDILGQVVKKGSGQLKEGVDKAGSIAGNIRPDFKESIDKGTSKIKEKIDQGSDEAVNKLNKPKK